MPSLVEEQGAIGTCCAKARAAFRAIATLYPLFLPCAFDYFGGIVGAMNVKETDNTCCTPARVPGPESQINDQATPHTSSGAGAQEPRHQPEQPIEMVVAEIPGGEAFVGTSNPQLPVDGEGVVKSKRLKPFRMGVSAVTNAQFAAFVAATGYVTEAERLGDSFVFAGFLDNPEAFDGVPQAPWWRMVPGASWRLLAGEGSEAQWQPDSPVSQVSWNDAQAFAQWAGGRLPTEFEWEHAARGRLGDVPYPWGHQEPDERDFFPCNIWQGEFPARDLGLDGYQGLAPAQSYQPNGYGLFNMVGNAWEWLADPFSPRSISKAVKAAHAGKKGFKVSKGGSFLCHKSYCFRYRIAARSGNSPDSATNHQSFRLVFDVE